MKVSKGHLTYCTNIHSGEAWVDHFEELKQNFPLIKEQVSKTQSMGIGLRLSNAASIDLKNSGKLQEFKSWLTDNDAYVFTMNGFPYGDFHHSIVKDQVHSPDWTTKERLNYTLRLFEILANLLPAGMDGGISTSPLSYRFWFATDEARLEAERKATANVISVVEKLFVLKKERGISMHLDIEPEPDGMLETGQEFIDWYNNVLLPMAAEVLPAKLNITKDKVVELVKKHICLCYDVCHFAIGYESHQEVLDQLADNQIKVGKIQISAALKSDLPDGKDSRQFIGNSFSTFNEPTYLHQVVARTNNRNLLRYRDLPEALEDLENAEVIEWRAHFHVPVFIADMGVLKSTQSDIIEMLQIQKEKPFTTHLEVETYTWEVLPDTFKAPMDESISRELMWVKNIIDTQAV